MKLTFKDICNVHKKITDVVKWTETSYSNQISEKIGIVLILSLKIVNILVHLRLEVLIQNYYPYLKKKKMSV